MSVPIRKRGSRRVDPAREKQTGTSWDEIWMQRNLLRRVGRQSNCLKLSLPSSLCPRPGACKTFIFIWKTISATVPTAAAAASSSSFQESETVEASCFYSSVMFLCSPSCCRLWRAKFERGVGELTEWPRVTKERRWRRVQTARHHLGVWAPEPLPKSAAVRPAGRGLIQTSFCYPH